MVDFLSFLQVQHWIVSMEEVKDYSIIFEGNSCFLTGKSDFIALKAADGVGGHYFEPFSIPLQIAISSGGELYFIFKDLANKPLCCTQVALEGIRYFRLTRSKFQPQLPPHASFDFDKVKLRIWTNAPNTCSFALPLFRRICALEIPSSRKRRLDSCYVPPTVQDLEIIAAAIVSIQSSSTSEQQQTFYDSITDIIRTLNGKV